MLLHVASADSALTPAQIFGRRVREARDERGLSQAELAKRAHVERWTINRLEKGGGGRKDVTLREVFEIAAALNVAPVHLLVPLDDEEPVEIVPGNDDERRVLPARKARAWIRGERVLPGADPRAFARQVPESELRALVEAWLIRRAGGDLEWALIEPARREGMVVALVTGLRNLIPPPEDQEQAREKEE
jgi:transcriptional regulator with XRE-family HTH domain